MSLASTGTPPTSASRAARSDKARALARWGLAARGGIYIVMGFLAFAVANGDTKEVDQSGALREVADQPFGTVLVVLLAIGFVGYALWLLSEAIWGLTSDEDKPSNRAISVVRAIAYVFLAFTAFRVLGGSQSSNSDKQAGYAAELMEHSGGRWLVGIGGVILIGVGIYMFVEGVRKKFLRYFPAGQLDATRRNTVEKLGIIGNASRGAVFAGAGALVIAAAVTYDPDKAAGIDATVKMLHDNNLSWLLIIAALGLIAFGIYGLFEAKYRRV